MEEFFCFVASIFNINRKDLSLQTEYGTIKQWDSVMHLRLVMEFEDKYGIEIPIDQIPLMKKLSDFYSLIAKDKQ